MKKEDGSPPHLENAARQEGWRIPLSARSIRFRKVMSGKLSSPSVGLLCERVLRDTAARYLGAFRPPWLSRCADGGRHHGWEDVPGDLRPGIAYVIRVVGDQVMPKKVNQGAVFFQY